MAFKATGLAIGVIIWSGGNTATHTIIHNMGQGWNVIGPMSEEAWLDLVATTFALRVVHCLDGVLQHRSHYGDRAFASIIARQDTLLRRHEREMNDKWNSN